MSVPIGELAHWIPLKKGKDNQAKSSDDSNELVISESERNPVEVQWWFNFLTDKSIAPQLANYLFHEDVIHNPVERMEQYYIKQSDMHLAAWGTEKEIFSAATLLQVEIC